MTPADPAAATPTTPATPQDEVQFVDLPLATFQQQVTQFEALVTQAAALLVNPTRYTPDQRKHSGGKLRDGEAAVLENVLEVARKFPASFETLANLDFGVDPNKFEVELVSERLAKAGMLLPVLEKLNRFVRDISDCMLQLNEVGAKPSHEAYVLAKALARSSAVIASMIAPTVAFYSALGQAAAASRVANKAAAAIAASGGASKT